MIYGGVGLNENKYNDKCVRLRSANQKLKHNQWPQNKMYMNSNITNEVIKTNLFVRKENKD